MWRVLVYLALIAALAFGAAWLADQPGAVAFIWNGTSYSVGLAIAAIAFLFVIGMVILLWALARAILNLPTDMSRSSFARRRKRGLRALSRGMIAVGAGDESAARRHAKDAQRYLPRDEPLVLLLTAQAAQISGDRGAAENTFRAMAETPETRVLGLRGLYVEARRRGDAGAAWSYASEAARLAPAVNWANEAVLEGHCARGDWRSALDTVERRAALGLLDKRTSKRYRAVLLTADALTRGEADEEGSLRSVKEAVRLAPDLAPAATLAGQILARRMELRKAARIIETAWTATPHPDLASAYLHLRPGDSALDRMRRAETLAKLSTWSPEGRMALARAALEAREFHKARTTLEPILGERPTQRVCLLMADIERAEHGATGKAREWLARAVHAPRDKAWIADGIVSDRWSPISPVSGRLDAFVWAAPPELVSGVGLSVIDDVVADLDDRPGEPIAIEPPVYAKAEEAKPAPAEALERAAAAEPAPSAQARPAAPPEPARTEAPRPAPLEAAKPAEVREIQPARVAQPEPAAHEPAPEEKSAAVGAVQPTRTEPTVPESQPAREPQRSAPLAAVAAAPEDEPSAAADEKVKITEVARLPAKRGNGDSEAPEAPRSSEADAALHKVVVSPVPAKPNGPLDTHADSESRDAAASERRPESKPMRGPVLIDRLPDDPGADEEEKPKRSRFRLFG